MLRKKQHLIPAKEQTTRNAKVTVQYIQRRSPITSTCNTNHILGNSTAEELEVENVEYLEEAVNSEELVEEQVGGVVKEEYEDAFYPNAIQCLLDLYKEIYDNRITKTECKGAKFHAQVWRDIAKEMQESYFEFEADQIRHKYAALRQQYFDVRSVDDIENFDYFEQLHEIYKDPVREVILNGGNIREVTNQVLYKDEEIMKAMIYEEERTEEQCSDFKSKEIVHKEHAFIHMVEKELQAMEEPLEEEEYLHKQVKKEIRTRETSTEQPNIKDENQTLEDQKNLKRPLVDTESLEEVEPPKQKPKLSESKEKSPSPPAVDDHSSDPSYSELMTLKQYNVEQERRHREQMDFLGKQFRQHQTTLDQLSYQLQELVKRLPPTL